MRDTNVHNFPVAIGSTYTIEVLSPRAPEQLELFDHAYGTVHAISYLDIAVLDQDRFIRSVVMNAVTTIIDLRGVPVFPKPRFDHRFLMSYLYERSVEYIELAMTKEASEERVCASDALNKWFGGAKSSGLTTCIIDQNSLLDGAVASFRNSMAKSANAYVEIHPRALI